MADQATGCQLKDIMTQEVITVGPETTLRDVSKVLFENHVSGVPVIDEPDRLLGIVSETDIVAAVKSYERRLNMIFPEPSILSISFKPEYRETALQEAIQEFQGLKVKDIMTREIYVLGPEDTIQRAVLVMNSFGVNRIPIMKDGKLVGIVARHDIIRYLGTSDGTCLLATKAERPKSD